MVAAAGNWGSANRPAYPAAYKGVVASPRSTGTSSSTQRPTEGTISTSLRQAYRSTPPCPAAGGAERHVFASPYLAVLVALEITRGIKRDSGPLVKKLSGRTVDLGDPGKDSVFGWGLVEKEPACN